MLENELWIIGTHAKFQEGISIMVLLKRHIAKKLCCYFWLTIFGRSTCRRKKANDIFEILRKSESETCVFWNKIWKNWSYLTWSPSKVRLDDVIISNDRHYRHLRIKWLRKHVSHGLFVTFISSDFVTWPWT